MAKNKKPKNKKDPSKTKSPRSKSNPDRYLIKFPCWRFNLCDKEHRDWNANIEKFNKKLFEKLKNYETMTWEEIKRQTHDKGKSKNHFVGVSDLSKPAQNRIIELNYDDDQLFSLAFENKLRIYGRLDGGIFYIIWIDENHTVYPVKK